MAGSSRAVAALFLLFSAGRLAAATGPTYGEIAGTVRDEAGAAIVGARVTAHHRDTGFERTAQSGLDGRYRIVLLPVGRYTLTAEREGYPPSRVEDIELHLDETLTVPLTLTPAAFTAVVDVVAERPTLDLARSEPAAVLGRDAIAGLPIEGRRFHDFVLLTPGVVQVQQGFAAGGLAISGQRGIDTAFNVDGVSYDNPFFGGIRGGERSSFAYTLSQEAVAEFDVANAGYGVESGRSGGGRVDVVTKSGTNDLDGSLFWYFRDESMIARDPFGREATDFEQNQFGGSLGGPLRRDRTHYFLAYDQQRYRNPFVVEFSSDPIGVPGFEGEDGTFTQTNDIWTGFLRLDHRLNDRHRLTFRVNASRNEAENGISTSPTNLTPDQSSLEVDEIWNAVGEVDSVLSSAASQTVRLQWSREERPRYANSDPPTVVVDGLGGTGSAPFLPALEQDERDQLIYDGTWLRDRHALRFGGDLDFSHIEQPHFLLLSGGLYFFANVDDYVATLETGEQRWTVYFQGFGRSSVDFWQREYSAFVQDEWSLRDNLKLSAGLRWDALDNPEPDSPNPELAGSDQIPSEHDMLAPRLGLTWDPAADGRNVVRLSAGIYYSRTPALLLVAPITTNGKDQLQLLFLPFLPSAPTFPEVLPSPPTGAFAPPSDANVVSPDYRNARTTRVSIEAERELRPGWVAGVAYGYGKLDRLERLRDTNIFPAAGTAEDGRLLYPFERPDPRFNQILQIESTANGRYDGVTLSLRRRPAPGGASFQAYYTWSRSRDEDSNERDHLTIYYQDWQHLDREWGPSQNDTPHHFVASGIWPLRWGLQLGWIAVARSGLPYSHVSANDLNHDGVFGNDREFRDGQDTGRNAFRQPSYRRLDLRLSKAFHLRRESALELALDVFNVDAGPGGINPNLDDRDGQLGEPRSAQLSLRLRF
jgi:carboxypeptidase family protein/TonB-dependent receptor-like protein